LFSLSSSTAGAHILVNVNLMPLSTIVKQNLLSCDLLTMLLPNAEEDVDLSIPLKKIEVHVWAPFFSVAPFPLDS
jgi:hypothetical protein